MLEERAHEILIAQMVWLLRTILTSREVQTGRNVPRGALR
jgi:hypothetical protein